MIPAITSSDSTGRECRRGRSVIAFSCLASLSFHALWWTLLPLRYECRGVESEFDKADIVLCWRAEVPHAMPPPVNGQ